MTTPSKDPTISDLYLAFRQAKTALYFERRGVGLLEIAKYERAANGSMKSRLVRSGLFRSDSMQPMITLTG
jgi:hypothetical protein